MLGVRKTTDFIEKATWILAAALVVFSVACSFFDHQEVSDPSEIVTNMGTPTAPAKTPVQAPAAPAAPAQPAK